MTVYFTSVQNIQQKCRLNDLLKKIPRKFHYEINKYKQHNDRLVRVVSKILLKHVLQLKNYPQDTIIDLSKNKYGKPFIPGCFWFNIAHSGNIILLAVNDAHAVGVDVELIKNIDFMQYKTCFTKTEWQTILKSEHPLFTFYNLWTRKESVLKADGRGLSLDMAEIDVTENKVIGEPYTSNWYLSDISFNTYKAFVCAKTPYQNIPLHFINQTTLLAYT